ncbi:MAG: hypothetical protein H6Q72_2111 [Firmicutes bacterium]|nr:hypothetical protein [Bacillota bacterium]
MITSPYRKTAGISLLIHGVLFCWLLLVPTVPVLPKDTFVPIEVEVAAIGAENKTAYSKEASHAAAQRFEQSIVSAKEFSQKQVPVTQRMAEEQMPAIAVTSGEAQAVAAAGSQSAAGDTNGEQIEKPVTRSSTRYLSGSRPTYPRAALQAGQEGVVVIRVLVGADGSVGTVSVRRSSGHDLLDEAAAQAVKSWRFAPSRQGDTPVESYFDVRVKFSLAEAQATI